MPTQTLSTNFENALIDLIEQYIRDGLSVTEVREVLMARVNDDFDAWTEVDDMKRCNPHQR